MSRRIAENALIGMTVKPILKKRVGCMPTLLKKEVKSFCDFNLNDSQTYLYLYGNWVEVSSQLPGPISPSLYLASISFSDINSWRI